MSDGFDLGVDGEAGEIEFELHIGEQQNPKAIFIGKERKHPAKSPSPCPPRPSGPNREAGRG